MGDFQILGIPISLGTMIYQAAIFTVLVLLLKKFVFKKLVNVMETRKQYIERQLQLSEQYKHQAEKVLEDQTDLLKLARKQAINILNHSQEEANMIVNDAKKEAGKILKEAKKQALLIRSQTFEHEKSNKGA